MFQDMTIIMCKWLCKQLRLAKTEETKITEPCKIYRCFQHPLRSMKITEHVWSPAKVKNMKGKPHFMHLCSVLLLKGVTWEACCKVFDESLLRDGLTGRVHGRNGQAQDFSQWYKLGLADGRHADRRHITYKAQRSKVKDQLSVWQR